MVVALTQTMNFVSAPPKVGSVIRGGASATSLSYHDDGVHLFVASEEDSRLRLINCDSGTSDRPATKFERGGIRLVESTHHNLCVLYSCKGRKEQPPAQRFALHYLSLHDNKVLRNFSGHTGEITSISMNPEDDQFLTSSADKTVRLWTLEKAGCVAELQLPSSSAGVPYACYDQTGLVFGVMSSPDETNADRLLHLYDARNYSGGPFQEISVPCGSIDTALQGQVSADVASKLSQAKWNTMAFNREGNQILIGADMGLGIVMNGFEGTVESVLLAEGAGVLETPTFSGCFTPEDKTILGGNQDGTITCWDAKSKAVTCKLEGHPGRVTCIAANPKFAQIASTCTNNNTALWCW